MKLIMNNLWSCSPTFLVSSVTVVGYCQMLSHVFSILPHEHFHKCIQCTHIGNISLCYTICFSWEFSVLKLTFLWRRQWPHLLPDIWKHCKILKMPYLEFQIGFVFSTVCQNFHPTCQLQSCCLWNVKTEGCVNPSCSSCEWRCVKLVHRCPAVCQLVL